MANTQSQQMHISAMSFELATSMASSEAHVLPAGEFVPDDGRDMQVACFRIDEAIAARVISRMAARTNDTLIDYEHQSLFSTENGQPVIAAGWFRQMQYRSDGLWAVDIGWTSTAQNRIKEKEYRYISAVFAYDKSTGEVLDILSITLTNTPAVDGLQALAALTARFNQIEINQLARNLNAQHFNAQNLNKRGEVTMPEKEVAILATERDGLKTQVASLTADLTIATGSLASLTAELKTATDRIAAVEQEKADAAAATEKTTHAALVKAALSDARLAPAQKTWAEKQSLAALTEYLEVAAPLLDGQRQSVTTTTGAEGLTTDELEMCSRMHVKPAAYAETKAAEADKKRQQHAE